MPERSEKVNILLVDDNADKLLSLEAVLEPLGENVVRAHSGRDALRHALRSEFAVVLLDINMPGMDGFETAGLIRQHKNFTQTPIIFLTAFGDDFQAIRSYALGAVDYILTPVVPEILRSKVKVFVDLFRTTVRVREQAESLRERAAQLHKLAWASVAINTAPSLEAMLGAITDAARDVVGAHLAVTSVALEGVDWPAELVRTAVSSSDSYAKWRRYFPGSNIVGIGGLTCERDASRRLTKTELQAIGGGPDPQPDEPPLLGWLAANLNEADGSPVGLIQLTDKFEGDFDEDDEAMLVQLAQMASMSIQNYLHAEAREANRLKDEFLATLSHELRTPLNAMLGWTRILRDDPHDEQLVARGLEVIERNVNAQTRLIEELLDVSRISSGQLTIDPAPGTLAPLVEAAIDALRPAAIAKGVAIDLSLDGGAAPVRVDSDRFSQVITNLLANALKFTPEHGSIGVRIARLARDVVVTVSDTGAGIDPEFLPFVFDRFRQGDSTSRRVHGGLGIGLSVVRHIVELHGGTVEAASNGRGHGSTFTVCLPIARNATSTSGEHPAVPSHPSPVLRALGGLKVLLVEDDEDTRDVTAAVLKRGGAQVAAVSSAAEALEALREDKPDVLVSDLAMPEQDGYELIRSIRRLTSGEGKDIPALALSAHAGQEDRARAIASGFQLHAPKPIEPSELVSLVAGLALKARTEQRKSR